MSSKLFRNSPYSFKYHLLPKQKQGDSEFDVDELPEGKCLEDILADFMGYLFGETKRFIERSVHDGVKLWEEVSSSKRIDFVFGHPNGWSGVPQQRMRQSAILAGLVRTSKDATDRVKFVTEGEASALSCLGDMVRTADIKASSTTRMLLDTKCT